MAAERSTRTRMPAGMRRGRRARKTGQRAASRRPAPLPWPSRAPFRRCGLQVRPPRVCGRALDSPDARHARCRQRLAHTRQRGRRVLSRGHRLRRHPIGRSVAEAAHTCLPLRLPLPLASELAGGTAVAWQVGGVRLFVRRSSRCRPSMRVGAPATYLGQVISLHCQINYGSISTRRTDILS